MCVCVYMPRYDILGEVLEPGCDLRCKSLYSTCPGQTGGRIGLGGDVGG